MSRYREFVAQGAAGLVQAAAAKGLISVPSSAASSTSFSNGGTVAPDGTKKKVRGPYQGGYSRYAAREDVPPAGFIRHDGARCMGPQKFIGADGKPFWRAQFLSMEKYLEKKERDKKRVMARYYARKALRAATKKGNA